MTLNIKDMSVSKINEHILNIKLKETNWSNAKDKEKQLIVQLAIARWLYGNSDTDKKIACPFGGLGISFMIKIGMVVCYNTFKRIQKSNHNRTCYITNHCPCEAYALSTVKKQARYIINAKDITTAFNFPQPKKGE